MRTIEPAYRHEGGGATRAKRRAATLVDVLAVVGVVVVLAPLVMACLVDEREEARIGQCLANLRTLGVASEMYLADWDGECPPIVKRMAGDYLSVTNWFHGGKTNDDYWLTDSGGAFYLPVTERPLNPYLLGGRVEADVTSGNQVIERTEVPVLGCPADSLTYERSYTGGVYGPLYGLSTYDDVGTSYIFNLQSLRDTNVDEWGNDGQGWEELSHAILASTAEMQPDSFIWYLEGPLDWALYQQELTVGFHGELGRHSVMFRDGHAGYQYMDSMEWCGPGWEAININWQYSPGTPFGPIHYDRLSKRCCP